MAGVVRPGAAAGQRGDRAHAQRPRAIKARSARAGRRPGVVMAAFGAIAAILAVVVFAAVLWPLWRESRGVVFGAVVVLVLAALATYKLVGTPEAIDAPAAAVDATPRTMEEAVVQLEAELERNPGRADGWQLLARSYEMLDRRRSEEHTSELQSLMRISYAVFCLKKKKSHHIHQLLIAPKLINCPF